MTSIKRLDEKTINQIAAGEVVERPYSVVKELVENSIDSGADAITVEIVSGGIELIRVTDNGCGFYKDDIKEAFHRHATSKINSIDDLHKDISLGFRGEALSSIAGVSKVKLMTKRKEDFLGYLYEYKDHDMGEIEEIGIPDGTTVIVEDIFYNLPARRKFLKSPRSEANQIGDLMNKLALGNKHISFKLIVDGKVSLQTVASDDLKEVILAVFGKKTANNIDKIDYTSHYISIEGYIGQPILARGNRSQEIYFVNGRYVRDKWIMQGIEDAYKGYLMHKQYPFVVLDIKFDPSKVDINVHPSKMEIRFENEYIIQDHISRSIKEVLKRTEDIPEFKEEQEKKPEYIRTEFFEKTRNKLYEEKVFKENNNEHEDEQEKIDLKKTLSIQEGSSEFASKRLDEQSLSGEIGLNIFGEKLYSEVEQLDMAESGFINESSISKHRVIGQLFKTYWLVEYEDYLYIIDQHAAHEKVLYEKFVDQMNEGEIISQRILKPLLIEFRPAEYAAYKKYSKFFENLGFEIEEFGFNTIRIVGVPYIFNSTISEHQFMMIFDRLNDRLLDKPSDVIDHELATMGCKAAVKANDDLSEIEYHKLIDDLLSLRDPYHCPHGRPTIIKMSKYEIEKKIRRIV